MGDKSSFKSKEDFTGKISKSVFVTNFPEHLTARDLWNVCTAYGKVVDVYIPLKKSKIDSFVAVCGTRIASSMRLMLVSTSVNLIDLSLEGYSYTWALKSASKISKLDRFLIFEGPNISFISHMFKKISQDQNDDLESEVTYDEIKKVVWDCGTNKFPGPDRITFEFIRKYWKIIQQDVVNAVKEVFSSSKFPPGSNSLFIALIPKSLEAKMVKDFRPISLIGLKQGDPLSPFFFLLVMESLHISFNNILNARMYKGIRIDDSLSLSHLFYADDTVFIGKRDKANVIVRNKCNS
nr:transposon TX1 uncharacterized [Tanacetum cinerariifolium]